MPSDVDPLRSGWSQVTGTLRRARVGMLAAVVMFGAGSLVWVGNSAATADSVSSVRGQMSTVERHIIADASRIHALTLAYGQDVSEVAALNQQELAQQAQAGVLSAEADSSRSTLRNELLLGYVGEYGDATAGMGSGTADPSIRAGYIAIAAGSLRDALDSYLSRKAALGETTVRLEDTEAHLRTESARAQAARVAALTDAKSAQGQLDQLQAELIDLQRQADQDDSSPTGVQGLPVGGGLVSVVASQVPPTSTGLPQPTTGTSGATTTSTLPPRQSATTVAGTTSTTIGSLGSGGAPGVWLELRMCESGDNYAANTGNGYYGAYQFSQATWTWLGFPGRPDLEPPSMQDSAAAMLQARSGWGQWPACAAALGLIP